jgi:hypothetical protein
MAGRWEEMQMGNGLSRVVAIAVTGALLAGCRAGGEGEQARTGEAFMARANRICTETQEKIYAIPEPSDPDSLEATSAYFKQVLAIQEERLEGFRELSPPRANRAAFDALTAEFAKGLKAIEDAVEAAAKDDRAALEASGEKIQESVAARSELARRARLMECVNILSGQVVLEEGPKDAILASEEPFNLQFYRSLLSNLRGREMSEAEVAVLSDNGFVAGFVRRWTTEGASFLIEAMELKTAAGAQAARTALEQLPPPEGVQIRDRQPLQVPGIAGASGFSYALEGPSGASFVDEIFFVRGLRLFRVSSTSATKQASDEVLNLARRQESLAVRGIPAPKPASD